MEWSEKIGSVTTTFIANYRHVSGTNGARVVRITCSGVGSPPFTNGSEQNLTSDLPLLPGGWTPGDAPAAVNILHGFHRVDDLDVSSNVATATVVAGHNYTTGLEVVVEGTGNADIDNGAFIITDVGGRRHDDTFTFSVSTSDVNDLTGTAHTDDPTYPVELVTMELTTFDGDIVRTDSASKNPADTLPTTTLPSWIPPTPSTIPNVNTPPDDYEPGVRRCSPGPPRPRST